MDENGRVHYGDKPPDQQSTPMHLDTQPPAGADGGARQEKQQKLLDTFSEERDEHRKEVEAAAQEKKKRLANCEQVRKYLADLTRANYLYKEGSDPANPQVLTDLEREAELKKGQDAVKKWCGPGG